MASLEGRKQLNATSKRLRENLFETLKEELTEASAEVLSRSRDLAPQLTGLMISESGTDIEVTRGALGPKTVTTSVFYGVKSGEPDQGPGESAVYAVLQHELEFNPGPITRTKPGAGRKYLSRAFDEKKRAILLKAARALQSTIRQTVR